MWRILSKASPRTRSLLHTTVRELPFTLMLAVAVARYMRLV